MAIHTKSRSLSCTHTWASGHTHLRGEVFWCATECLCGGTITDLLLTQSKVSQLDVTLTVQQQVLQLTQH